MGRAAGPQRILVVEDNPADVMLLRMALDEAGVVADLTVCADGEAAIAHIQSAAEPPEVVLLDLNIPCHDGLEVLQMLREANIWPGTPIVVFTSSITRLDQDRIEGYGASVLRKPQSYSGFVSAAMEIAQAGEAPHVAVDAQFSTAGVTVI
jgi:CheY-like chemotaxis protein